jgi:hypothetical protein
VEASNVTKKGKEMYTTEELESKRITNAFHREVEKQEIRKLEQAIGDADILMENVKSDSHIGNFTRDNMLKEISDVKQQAQDRLKAMNEKRMQELVDLQEKSIFTISTNAPLTVSYTHVLDAVAMGYLDDGVIESLCKYHNNPDNAKKFEAINEAAKNFLRVIRDNCPDCSGRVDAVKTVLLARMQANATIALSGV